MRRAAVVVGSVAWLCLPLEVVIDVSVATAIGLRRRRTRYTTGFNPANGVQYTGFETSNRFPKDMIGTTDEADLRAVFFSMTRAPMESSPQPTVAPPTPSPVDPAPSSTEAPATPPSQNTVAPTVAGTPTLTPFTVSPTLVDIDSTVPTTPPAEPPTREDRDIAIQLKCGITALERSRDILTELLTVSDALSLVNPDTSQFTARNWIDNVDAAIICPENPERIHQRYRLALLYYEMGGGDWTVCNAVTEDEGAMEQTSGRIDVADSKDMYADAVDRPRSGINATMLNVTRNSVTEFAQPSLAPFEEASQIPSDMPSLVPSLQPSSTPVANATNVTAVSATTRQAACPGVPFLSRQNECEWYGIVCSSDYDPVAGDMYDEYFPLEALELPFNNLNGALFVELYGFERLERLSLRGNLFITGTISSQIGQLGPTLKELDLGGNGISGTLPDSLFALTELTTLILNGNGLEGVVSTTIGNMVKLNELQLQVNSFTGTIPVGGLLAMEELGMLFWI